MAVGQQIDLGSGNGNRRPSAEGTTPTPTTSSGGQRGIASRRQAEAVSPPQPLRGLRCDRLSSPSHEQDDQHDNEDGAQPAADVRAAKVEAAAAEENDQDDQKDNQAHDVLPVSAECQA